MTSVDWSAQVGDGPTEYQQFLVPGMFAPFAARLVADLEITPGSAVLDIACGTGVVSRLAARAAGPTGTVTGVDIGPAMLDVARSQPAESGSAPITYLEGSALELLLADSSFDCATCHHGFQFFPDRVAAIRELRRMLPPAGRVAVACWTSLEATPGFRAIRDSLHLRVSEQAGQMMNSPFRGPGNRPDGAARNGRVHQRQAGACRAHGVLPGRSALGRSLPARSQRSSIRHPLRLERQSLPPSWRRSSLTSTATP